MELMDKDMFSFSIGGEKIGGDGAERGGKKEMTLTSRVSTEFPASKYLT